MIKPRTVMVLILRRLMIARHGEDTFEYWMWECTPYPFATPSWREIRNGFRLAFSPRRKPKAVKQ